MRVCRVETVCGRAKVYGNIVHLHLGKERGDGTESSEEGRRFACNSEREGSTTGLRCSSGCTRRSGSSATAG